MKKLILAPILLISILLLFGVNENPELVIGEERLEPGIVFIFEGAIKDDIMPGMMHLSEKETNIHIEARVNWDVKDVPAGTPTGGFIPYLHISAKLINEKTGFSTFIDLVPHINLIDNFHYARNISLPGLITDTYTVRFNIVRPTGIDLALHKDWLDTYGESLINNNSFVYKGVDFEEVAKANRR
jgi:uncharacterized protein involved in high-affinity Fe2+ transport|tara:strand:+ start:2345 stop:2899 length:555 start_codon:yes stop_codon:yes gene_type:complete